MKLEFVSEDNGWTQVIFQGQTGYVSSDYVKSDMADSTTDSAHQVRQIAGLPVRVQQMAVQQELQIVLHSHSNRYVVR